MDFEVGGYRMHYEVFGDSTGEPLLWLHGWSGTGQDWQYIFKEVPAEFQLISPDLKGNGSSTGFEALTPFANRRATSGHCSITCRFSASRLSD